MARRVLVTGASKGIGRAIAQRFAGTGDRVAVHYCSDEAAAKETLTGLKRSDAGEHVSLRADLASPAASVRLVEQAIAEIGGLDILICNHGIYEETPVETTNASEWAASFERVLRINTIAPAELAHAAGKHMQQQGGGGAIVFVSSRGAYRGEPLAPAYGASKAAINSLTGSLAQALAPHGIRVAAVAPGFVSTAMAATVLSGPRYAA